MYKHRDKREIFTFVKFTVYPYKLIITQKKQSVNRILIAITHTTKKGNAHMNTCKTIQHGVSRYLGYTIFVGITLHS